MAEIHELRVNENTLDTVLAEDISFDGNLSFTKELMIKGEFSGKINAKGKLYISENAIVYAEIKADSVYVRGQVNGTIEAKTRVELQGEAIVVGDITAPKIIMGKDCRFDGMSRMSNKKENTE